MLFKYPGDFFFEGCFCYGVMADGTLHCFDSVEEYENFREKYDLDLCLRERKGERKHDRQTRV